MQRFWLGFFGRILGLMFVLSFVLFSVASSQPAYAQHRNNLIKCTMPDGDPFAGQDLFLRYEGGTGRVVLVSWQTGEITHVLDEGVWTTQFDVRTWLDNCQYLIASVGPLGQQSTIAYNIQESRRIGDIFTATHAYVSGGTIATNVPDLVLIQSTSGAYLWNLSNNERVQLPLPANGYGINLYNLRVDTQRGWIRFETPSDPGTLNIWDYRTAQPLLTISNGPDAAEVNDVYLGNNWEALIGGSRTPDYAVGNFSSHLISTLWNYDTLETIELYRVFRGLGKIVFSPSGRYMAIYGSFIQVYDMTQPQPLSPFVETDVRNFWSYRTRIGRFSPDETRLEFVIYSQNSARDRYAPLEIRYVRYLVFDIAAATMTVDETYDPDVCERPDWTSANITADHWAWGCSQVPY